MFLHTGFISLKKYLSTPHINRKPVKHVIPYLPNNPYKYFYNIG